MNKQPSTLAEMLVDDFEIALDYFWKNDMAGTHEIHKARAALLEYITSLEERVKQQ